MVVYIGLVSRSKMDEFNSRFGGFTGAAIDEFCRLEAPGNCSSYYFALPKLFEKPREA